MGSLRPLASGPKEDSDPLILLDELQLPPSWSEREVWDRLRGPREAPPAGLGRKQASGWGEASWVGDNVGVSPE